MPGLGRMHNGIAERYLFSSSVLDRSLCVHVELTKIEMYVSFLLQRFGAERFLCLQLRILCNVYLFVHTFDNFCHMKTFCV